MKIRRQFERVRVQFVTDGPSRTHQSFKDSCDVNNILARYQRTGVLPPGTGQGQFADVTALQGDLTERINWSREVQAQFVENVNEYRKAEAEKAKKEKDSVVKPGKEKDSVVKPGEGGSITPPAGT